MLFFTLSATDTKWHDFHKVILDIDKQIINLSRKQFIDNVIENPHITTLYLHQMFTILYEEVTQNLLHVTNHWYIYEWRCHGSQNIHGFLWIHNLPKMYMTDWSNNSHVKIVKTLFDKYVSTWNPCSKI